MTEHWNKKGHKSSHFSKGIGLVGNPCSEMRRDKGTAVTPEFTWLSICKGIFVHFCPVHSARHRCQSASWPPNVAEVCTSTRVTTLDFCHKIVSMSGFTQNDHKWNCLRDKCHVIRFIEQFWTSLNWFSTLFSQIFKSSPSYSPCSLEISESASFSFFSFPPFLLILLRFSSYSPPFPQILLLILRIFLLDYPSVFLISMRLGSWLPNTVSKATAS